MANFQDKLNNLKLSDILSNAEKLEKRPQNEQQLTSYDSMLKFAQRCMKNFDEITLIGLAHMAYGWMPTMIKRIKKDDLDLKMWKRKIQRGEIDSSFLKQMMDLTNNSIVGTSKLLHFLNPDVYPIFDSKVYKSIAGQGKHNISKDVENYMRYCERLRCLVSGEKSKISQIRKILIDNDYIPKVCSDIRVLEVCLYASIKKEKK